MTKVINNIEAIEAIDHIQKCNLPCLLLGETGTGKTTIVKAVAEKYGKHLTRINLNGQTGREELIGKYVLIGGETKWQDGPLLTALKLGHWILLDEINAALPEVLFTIQALTESVDGKLGNILLAEKDGEIVITHPECRIFGTANPSDKYVGTKAFNPATLSRFVVIDVPVLGSADEEKLLTERYPSANKEDVLRIVKIGAELRKVYNKGDIEFFCSTRELVNTTSLLSSGLPIDKAVNIAIVNKVQNKFETADIIKIINPIVRLSDKDIDANWKLFVDQDKKVKEYKDAVDKAKAEAEESNKAKAKAEDALKKIKEQMEAQTKLLDRAKVIVEKFSKAATLFQSKGIGTTEPVTPSTEPTEGSVKTVNPTLL